MSASYNMASVTDGGGAGNTDHLFATDFSSAEYCLTVGGGSDDRFVTAIDTTYLAGGVTTLTQNSVGTDLDNAHNMMAIFGDQA